MDLEAIKIYIRNAFPHFPWWHWGIIVFIAIGVSLGMKKREELPVYAAFMLAIGVFWGAFLFDGIVLNRLYSNSQMYSGLDLCAEFRRTFSGGTDHWNGQLLNIAVFVPLGLSLFEYLSAASWQNARSHFWIGRVAIISFLLSFSMEGLQWILKVGFFEVSDLVLNTLGAVIGALIAKGIRSVVKCLK